MSKMRKIILFTGIGILFMLGSLNFARAETDFALSNGVGPKTVYVWVKDSTDSRMNMGPASANITLILATNPLDDPTLVLWDLTSGSTGYTDDRVVGVEVVNDNDVKEWFISEDQNSPPNKDDNRWINKPATFRLSDEEGLKRVYIWVMNDTSNINTGPVSATITLDTSPPSLVALEVEKDKSRTLYDGEIIGVLSDAWVEARFDDAMDAESVKEGIMCIALKDNLNNTINKEVALNFEWDSSIKTVRLTPRDQSLGEELPL